MDPEVTADAGGNASISSGWILTENHFSDSICLESTLQSYKEASCKFWLQSTAMKPLFAVNSTRRETMIPSQIRPFLRSPMRLDRYSAVPESSSSFYFFAASYHEYGVGGEENARRNPLQSPPDGRAHRPLLLQTVSTEKNILARRTVTLWPLPRRLCSARSPRLYLTCWSFRMTGTSARVG